MFENWTSKDFRKAAFGVGFGFTLGKTMAKIIDSMVGGFLVGAFKKSAEDGNEVAQEICNKAKVDYKKPGTTEEQPKAKIGFH